MVQKRQSKKGLELSINTIIILVLVVLVLVIVAVFFTGTTGKLANQIKSIFFGSTAGYDRSLAIQNCESYCDQLQTFGSEEAQTRASSSAYCKQSFLVDTDNDGKADTRFYCSDNPAVVPTGDTTEGIRAAMSLQVPCAVGSTTITCSGGT